jgi:hypothetical protein
MPMDDAMSAGFPPALALRIGVSVGKTEAVLDLLADPASFNLDVYYFVPEHKLSDEIADRFTMKSLARGGPPGVVIRGREQVHPSGEPMCHKSDIARQVARLGASVRHTLCETEGRGGQRDEYCEHHPARGGTCRYIAQLRTPRPAVWLMPHQYAFLPRLEGLLSPDLVVFDESFWQAALRGVDGPPSKRPFIRPDQLRTPRYIPIKGRGDPALTSHRDYDLDATEELQRISEEVANLIEDGQLSPKDMIEAGFTHREANHAMGLEYRRLMPLKIRPGMSAADQAERLSRHVGSDVHRYARFWRILGAELESAPNREVFHGLVPGEVATEVGPVPGLFLRWSQDLAAHIREAPVLVLDATADPVILRRFLPQLVDIITIEATWPHVEVHQITDSVTGKSSLVPGAANEKEEQRRANRRDDLRRIVEVEVSRAGGPREDGRPRVLLATYKGALVRPDGTPLIAPVSGADFAWFNAMRGRDGWRDVDTLIVAGRTQPNVVHVEDMAAALFYREPEPIQRLEDPAYPREVRGYRMADESRFGVEADAHPDPRVEAVRRQICEAEIVQAVGRGRPARRSAERPLKVILLTSVPLPLTVHHLTNKDALMPDPIELLAARGAVPVEPWADLAEAYPDLFASADAARMTISRTLSPNKPLKEALIGVCSELQEIRYRRRRPNQRAVTGTLVYHPVRIDPALWLTEHLPGAEIQ